MSTTTHSVSTNSSQQTKLSHTIRIVQHNCARSINVMHSCLNSSKDNADIVLFQESWIANDNKSTVSHPAFTSLLPTSNNKFRPRTMAFISKTKQNLVCTPRSDISMNSDLQAISISSSEFSDILLLNIYNEKSQSEDDNS